MGASVITTQPAAAAEPGPSNLVVDSVGATNVTLSWTAAPTQPANYEAIYCVRTSPGVPCTPELSLWATNGANTSLFAYNIAHETTFDVAVRGLTAGVPTEPSNVVTFTTDTIRDPGPYPAPAPGYEEYAGCPILHAQNVNLCLAVTVNGNIQLGSVGGDISDLKMVMGLSAPTSGQPSIAAATGGGGPADVPVSGGILGIPELDPLLSIDLLKSLLGLSATPQLGSLQQTGLAELLTAHLFITANLGYPTAGNFVTPEDDPIPMPAVGEDTCWDVFGEAVCIPTPELGLGLPLTLKLNNLLLGDDCNIGPISLALTNGTTTPPPGVPALTGSSGFMTRNQMGTGIGEGVRMDFDGIEFVGNDFEVPGSDCAGILGLGDTVDSLGLGNPFDTLINSQAGLPSPAGANTAKLTVDLHIASASSVYGSWGSTSVPSIDFGDVPVGTSVERSVTITNNRTAPRMLYNTGVNFDFIDGGSAQGSGSCTTIGLELAPGESCELTVTWSPSTPGARSPGAVIINANESQLQIPITGTAV